MVQLKLFLSLEILLRLKKPAKSSVVTKNGLKYVIYLPKFYIDFENKDGRDAGKDIA
jgi:hypothetical protein